MKPHISNINKLIKFSKGGILSKVIAKSNNSECTLFCLAKGTSMGKHTSAKYAYIYVVEGKGNFILEGKNIILEKGVFIFMPKKAVHELNAEENLAFLLWLSN